MKEIVERIEDLLARRGDILDFHELLAEEKLNAELFFMQAKLCLNYMIWKAKLAEKDGIAIPEDTAKYINRLSDKLRNHLFVLQNPRYNS